MITTGTNRWKLGLFVLLGLAGIVGALFWLGLARYQRESIFAVTYFDESVQGLENGSPVKFRGVTIGLVDDIRVAPDQRRVEVSAKIFVDALDRLGLPAPDKQLERDWNLSRSGLRAQLVSIGLTGVKSLEFNLFDPERHPAPDLPFHPPHNYIPSTPSTLKSLGDSLMAALDLAPGVMRDLRALLGNLDRFLGEAEKDDLLGALKRILERASAKLDELDLAGLQGEARAGVADLRATLGDVRVQIARLASNRTPELVESLAARLADPGGPLLTLLDRLPGAVETFEKTLAAAEPGPTTAALRQGASAFTELSDQWRRLGVQLTSDLRLLRRTLEAIERLTASLERDPGALLHGRTPYPPAPERKR